MDNREEFAQWLDDKLHQKGLKRAEFARLTGISAPQITRILKREQRAGPGSIKAIAKFLEVDEESLYKLAGYRTVRIKKIDEEVIALYDKINEETWSAVQQLMDERAKKHAYNHPRAVRSRYILSGLLKCGECGAPMVGRVLKRERYPDYLSYGCTGRANVERTCRASLIRKELIEQRVIQAVRDRILVPAELDAAYRLARQVVSSGDTSRQAELQRAKGELTDLEKSIARLILAIRDAGHSAALLAELAALEEQQRQAEERLAKLEAARPRELPEMDMDKVIETIREKLSSAIPSDISQVLRGFLISVFARKSRGKELTGEIIYRLPALGLPDQFVIPL